MAALQICSTNTLTLSAKDAAKDLVEWAIKEDGTQEHSVLQTREIGLADFVSSPAPSLKYKSSELVKTLLAETL